MDNKQTLIIGLIIVIAIVLTYFMWMNSFVQKGSNWIFGSIGGLVVAIGATFAIRAVLKPKISI